MLTSRTAALALLATPGPIAPPVAIPTPLAQRRDRLLSGIVGARADRDWPAYARLVAQLADVDALQAEEQARADAENEPGRMDAQRLAALDALDAAGKLG